MGFPGDLDTIKVTGTFLDVSGHPLSGKVTFDSGQTLVDTTGGVVFRSPATRYVQNGVMQPVILPCTDNADLNPTGFAYTVTVAIDGVASYSEQVALPHSLGDTVDVSAFTPVTDPVAANTFTGDNTWTGEQTFTGGVVFPSGAASGRVWTAQDSDGNGAWEPVGGSGGSDANFTQAFHSVSTVNVTHNLGKIPAVTVIDSANDACVGDVEYTNTNQLVVSFSAPFSGTVICN